jgi:hypothetical protein
MENRYKHSSALFCHAYDFSSSKSTANSSLIAASQSISKIVLWLVSILPSKLEWMMELMNYLDKDNNDIVIHYEDFTKRGITYLKHCNKEKIIETLILHNGSTMKRSFKNKR